MDLAGTVDLPPDGKVKPRGGDPVTERIAELNRARHALEHLAARATAQDPADCHGYCAILAP